MIHLLPNGRVALSLAMLVVIQQHCGVEILLSNGRMVRIWPGFDRQTLLDVLGVLEGARMLGLPEVVAIPVGSGLTLATSCTA